MQDDEWRWANQEFGRAALGDIRRTTRLVAVAAALASRPAGTVTQVIEDAAGREGAYRLLESERISSAALMATRHEATVRRCEGLPSVFVAVDGSSLTVTDRMRKRDVGGVGPWDKGARGLQAISALAVGPDGAPIGLCGQAWWSRTGRTKNRYAPRDARQGEHKHALRVIDEVRSTFAEWAPQTRPWLQFDRGYDAWLVLTHLVDHHVAFTVRATQDRLLNQRRRPLKLWSALRQSRPLGQRVVEVPARGTEPARRAILTVHAKAVELVLTLGSGPKRKLPLTAVLATEQGVTVGRLEWMLLTSEPATTLKAASTVLDGYSTRWRIEEFHRQWKRGMCNVEQTQLRGREALLKWATLHGAVATRALRLTHLAREQPDLPASNEFTQDEIDAVILLRDRRKRVTGRKLGDVPTMGELVRWVADLGGYTGKSSGGPPGATVIGRGLERIATAAQVVALMRPPEM